MMNATTRIGFHYFPDTHHYRDQDLQTWLPELKALGASWLTLLTPTERAIPENFISNLVAEHINPVLHFTIPPEPAAKELDLKLLFENYARWGVRYVALFDRPNTRQVWAPLAWSQQDPVENFLDLFIPLAEAALNAGLIPVFPPLEPGGDYWDTIFLQLSLRGLQRRNREQLLDHLAIGAYGWTYDRPLDWGAGGPERWPESQPYFTPSGSQDQIGFNIYNWYQAIVQAELGRYKPVILLRAGARTSDFSDNKTSIHHEKIFAERNLSIARKYSKISNSENSGVRRSWSASTPHSMQDEIESDQAPVGEDQVVCINFWLLAADPESPHASSGWYSSDGQARSVAKAMQQLAARINKGVDFYWPGNLDPDGAGYLLGVKSFGKVTSDDGSFVKGLDPLSNRPIEHYLLMPMYAWGVAEWDLQAVQPFLQQHHPTIGFSLQEAALAARVTLYGEANYLVDAAREVLLAAGCQVERLNRDGTLLAI